MNMSYHKDILEYPHSSFFSETTDDSNIQGEIALRVNLWGSMVNEPMLMRLNWEENQSILYQLDSLLSYSSDKFSHNYKWALKETASYYVKKANVWGMQEKRKNNMALSHPSHVFIWLLILSFSIVIPFLTPLLPSRPSSTILSWQSSLNKNALHDNFICGINRRLMRPSRIQETEL